MSSVVPVLYEPLRARGRDTLRARQLLHSGFPAFDFGSTFRDRVLSTGVSWTR